MPVDLHPLDGASVPSHPAAAVVHPSIVGAHVALFYQSDDSGSRRLLHQAWHHKTCDDDPGTYADEAEIALQWVAPGLDDDELNDLRTHAALVAKHIRARTIPYAIAARDAAILSDGSVTLGESLGLTCATFLLALFDAAQVKLLALGSWDTDRTAERCDEDEAAQRQIVLHLRSHDPGHARLVEQDVGCTRVRAEEVAAASGMTERPADFARVEPEGRSVLSRLWR